MQEYIIRSSILRLVTYVKILILLYSTSLNPLVKVRIFIFLLRMLEGTMLSCCSILTSKLFLF